MRSSRQRGVWFCCLEKVKFQSGTGSVHVASSGSLAALGAVDDVKASILQLKELVFESVFTIIPVFLALRSLLPILRVACWAKCFRATEHAALLCSSRLRAQHLFSLASGTVAESVDLLGSDEEVEAAVQKTLGLIEVMSSLFHNEYCSHSPQSLHNSFSSVASCRCI